jgi:DNA ligase-1
MRKLAEACERIAGTTKNLEKVSIVADYLRSRTMEEAAVSAIFLSGRPFPMWQEATLQVGRSLLWRIVQELSGKSQQELTAAYRKLGDLGAVAGEILRSHEGSDVSAIEVQQRFQKIAATRGPTAKAALVRELLSQVTPREAKYIVKIMTGDLRIGLKESLVEEAIAKGLWRDVGRSAARQYAAG